MKFFLHKQNILALTLCLFFVLPVLARAQESQILSVTPPLFQLSISPGDFWQSTVKVINGNNYPLTVYAEVVNFESQGESGQGKFVPIMNANDEFKTSTLAEWIDIEKGPYTIPPEQSYQISFSIKLPDDAPPGGHFAALLVGTEPPKDSKNKLVVQTSQAVTSLFFVRVEGEVVEDARIREFSTAENFVQSPEVEFSLRFENRGNVHLLPRGDIVITNMWGQVRGIIPINKKTHFGNVLPNSIRDFRFTWKGDSSITEIGRYKAIATLSYGENGIKNIDSTTYFWVIPVKATVMTLGVIALFFLIITWIIRLYIRKVLALAGVDVTTLEHVGTAHTLENKRDVRLVRYRTVTAPLTHGALDLQKRLKGVTEFFGVIKTLIQFVFQYKVFFLSVLFLIAGFVGVVLYINEASTDMRNYEITVKNGESEQTINSEQILKDQQTQEYDISDPAKLFEIMLINTTGNSQLGQETENILTEQGYRVTPVNNTDIASTTKTTIYYTDDLAKTTLKIISSLTQAFGNTFNPELETLPVETPSSTIRIMLGSDALPE